MFKYKVLVSLKSGNSMYLRCKSFDFTSKVNIFVDTNNYLEKIPPETIEAYIVKKWWQRWD